MQETIKIVLSANNNFVLPLCATIKSISNNSSKTNNYEIYILSSDITTKNKELIKQNVKKNIKINYINIDNYLDKEIKDSLFESKHITKETYYRIFIPKIFNKEEKIVYLDCDLIVKQDIKKLFEISLENNILGAILNPKNTTMQKYREEVLKINQNNYFNAGVLVFNIQEYIKNDIEKKCLELLKTTLKEPLCWDQDLLNITCKDRIKYLDKNWNLQWAPYINKTSYSKDELEFFKDNYSKSKIIHFTTNKKPWNFKSLYSLIWWHYILQTNFRFKALKLIKKCLKF